MPLRCCSIVLLIMALCASLTACITAQQAMPTIVQPAMATITKISALPVTVGPTFIKPWTMTPTPTRTPIPASPTMLVTGGRAEVEPGGTPCGAATLPPTIIPRLQVTGTVGAYMNIDPPAVLNGLDMNIYWGSSPNRDWYFGYGKSQIIGPEKRIEAYPIVFRSTDGKTEWTVMPDHKDLYGASYIDLMFYPIFWLPEGSYVYLTFTGYGHVNAREIHPGDNFRFHERQSLLRLNLSNGQQDWQITGTDDHYLQFASDGAYYLQATAGKPELIIHRLVDGPKTIISLPKTWVYNGNALISADNRQILIESCDYQQGHCLSMPLLLVDVAAGTYEVMIRDLVKTLGEVNGPGQPVGPQMTWVNESQVQLTTKDMNQMMQRWVLDLKTGLVKKVE